MSATQTLEIYKILFRYFKSEEDAARAVQDIEQIIENKFESNKEILATKGDIFALKEDIVRLEIKLNDHVKWIMATIIAMGGLIVAMIKLL